MSVNKIKAYAKINLALNVTGKLTSLHKIESIISFINLYDLIFIQKIKSLHHQVYFFGKFSKDISKNNTVIKLLKILDKKKLLKKKNLRLQLKKIYLKKLG